jgi:hypothetical protein
MIQNEQYQKFLKNVVDQLQGEWLIIGGSLLALIQASGRYTTDIDLCPLQDLTNDMRLNLMEIATQSGLSIDAINPAADFFVRQIPNWKSQIVMFMQGQKGRLFRPTLQLYFQLKLARLSESDLADCFSYYEWHVQSGIEFSKNVLSELVRSKLQVETDQNQITKLNSLLRVIA